MTIFQFQLFLDNPQNPSAAPDMTGRSPTDLDQISASRGGMKLGIEGENALYLTGRDPQGFGDKRNGLLRDITETLLDLLEDRNQGFLIPGVAIYYFFDILKHNDSLSLYSLIKRTGQCLCKDPLLRGSQKVSKSLLISKSG